MARRLACAPAYVSLLACIFSYGADIMASNRVVYSPLPPGGRVSGLRHVWSDALSPESQAPWCAALAGDLTEVIVEEGLKLLQCSLGDELDGWLSEIMGQTCRELRTRGDGFYGIRSLRSVTS